MPSLPEPASAVFCAVFHVVGEKRQKQLLRCAQQLLKRSVRGGLPQDLLCQFVLFSLLGCCTVQRAPDELALRRQHVRRMPHGIRRRITIKRVIFLSDLLDLQIFKAPADLLGTSWRNEAHGKEPSEPLHHIVFQNFIGSEGKTSPFGKPRLPISSGRLEISPLVRLHPIVTWNSP